jgi:hypothetical protein
LKIDQETDCVTHVFVTKYYGFILDESEEGKKADKFVWHDPALAVKVKEEKKSKKITQWHVTFKSEDKPDWHGFKDLISYGIDNTFEDTSCKSNATNSGSTIYMPAIISQYYKLLDVLNLRGEVDVDIFSLLCSGNKQITGVTAYKMHRIDNIAYKINNNMKVTFYAHFIKESSIFLSRVEHFLKKSNIHNVLSISEAVIKDRMYQNVKYIHRNYVAYFSSLDFTANLEDFYIAKFLQFKEIVVQAALDAYDAYYDKNLYSKDIKILTKNRINLRKNLNKEIKHEIG